MFNSESALGRVHIGLSLRRFVASLHTCEFPWGGAKILGHQLIRLRLQSAVNAKESILGRQRSKFHKKTPQAQEKKTKRKTNHAVRKNLSSLVL
jgi:hypothetical protein